ncbi:hypothetical protein E2C01_024736 [Portunus trituberculatus]|uniref:Uncharacterized protein n=1 Tax=Portunus trituberculatus TaxID=210409 RepID=A0A5B7EDQ0_PORTR|nr:hypothetical protein [Portunus trituberculatus]
MNLRASERIITACPEGLEGSSGGSCSSSCPWRPLALDGPFQTCPALTRPLSGRLKDLKGPEGVVLRCFAAS